MTKKEFVQKLIQFDDDNCSLIEDFLYDNGALNNALEVFEKNSFCIILTTKDNEVCIQGFNITENLIKGIKECLEDNETGWDIEKVIDLDNNKELKFTYKKDITIKMK